MKWLILITLLTTFVSTASADFDPVICGDLWPTYPMNHISKLRYCIPKRLGVSYSIYMEQDAIAADASIASIDQALAKSYGVYSVMGNLPKITFVILQTPDQPNSKNLAAAYPLLPGQSCPVFINPQGAQLSGADFEQLIAHEVFHCVQDANFYAQYRGPNAVNDKRITDWWLEATAEVMSAVAVPEGKISQNMAYTYDPNEQIHLQQNPYSNFLFFTEVAEAGNNLAQLKNMILSFPTGGDVTEQIRSLSRFPNIEDIFHKFAINFELGQILRPGSPNYYIVNNLPAAEEVIIYPASAPLGLQQLAGTIKKWKLKLSQGGNYTFKMINEGGRVSIKDGEGWNKLPYTYEVACGPNDAEVEAIGTHFKRSIFEFGPGVEVEYEQKECKCKEDSKIDPCLIGNWNLDLNSLEDMYKGMKGVTLMKLAGGVKLEVDKEKGLKVKLNDLLIKILIEVPDSDLLKSIMTFKGESLSVLNSETEKQLCITTNSGDVKIHTQVLRGDDVVADDTQTTDEFTGVAYANYSCHANELTIERQAMMNGKPGKMKLIFNRK